MFVRLLANLLLNPSNIPLRRFAFAAHRCPPSKGEFPLSMHDPIYLSKSMSDDYEPWPSSLTRKPSSTAAR